MGGLAFHLGGVKELRRLVFRNVLLRGEVKFEISVVLHRLHSENTAVDTVQGITALLQGAIAGQLPV